MTGIRALVGSNFLVRIAGGVHEYIFIILALRVTAGDTLTIGVIYFLRFLPYLILGPIAGLVSDGSNKRVILVATNAGRVFITLVFAAAIAGGELNAITLSAYGMAVMALRSFYAPALLSSIRFLVDSTRIRHSNSMNQFAMEIGLIIGPAAAALLARYGFGDVAILAADGALIALATAALLPVGRIDDSIGETRPKPSNALTLYADFYRITRMNRKDPTNLAIFVSGLCILFVGGTMGILIPSFVKDVHTNESLIGVVMSLFSVGAVCGSLLCSRLNVRLETQDLMFYWALYGAMFVVMPQIGNTFALLCCWALLVGLIGSFVDIAIPTIIQLRSNSDRIGSNFSFFNTVANTGDALSGPLAGILAAGLALGSAFVVIGSLVFAVAGVGYTLSMRSAGSGVAGARDASRASGRCGPGR